MIFHPLRTIFGSVGRHAATKLACHAAVGAWIAVLYYGPQIWPLFPPRPAPALPMDDWIPYQPMWALIYQTILLVHTLALWLPQDAEVVKSYARNVAIVFGCGAVIFWLCPTVSPRPEELGSFVYRWFVSAVDGPRNAFPSLHAALGLLGVVTISGHLRKCGVSPMWRVALLGWWVAMLYSTLATRQHRVLDLLAGTGLGLLSLALSPITTQTLPDHEPLPATPD